MDPISGNPVVESRVTMESIQLAAGSKLMFDKGGWGYITKEDGKVEWIKQFMKKNVVSKQGPAGEQ
eukprot:9716338-Prorocentrum_lima.AAC.1